MQNTYYSPARHRTKKKLLVTKFWLKKNSCYQILVWLSVYFYSMIFLFLVTHYLGTQQSWLSSVFICISLNTLQLDRRANCVRICYVSPCFLLSIITPFEKLVFCLSNQLFQHSTNNTIDKKTRSM